MKTPDSILVPVGLRYEEVLHFLGYPEGRHPVARIEHRAHELLTEARGLIDARGSYRHLSPERAGDVGLDALAAAGLVIGLVTAGDGIERRASELLARGDSVGALILEAMGSAAAEEAADRIGAIITARGPEPGEDHDAELSSLPEAAPVSCRLSPGYGRWPLRYQTHLFEQLPHRELGVALLPSLLMVPRKSISFAMWLGADLRPVTGLSGCARCGLTTCRYRREPHEGECR